MLGSDSYNSSAAYLLAGSAALLFLRYLLSPHSLRSLPTVGGPSIPLLSYIGAYNYVHHARTILQEGYDKYKGGMFKVPMLERWLVVVTGPKLVDELQRFPDEYVSFTAANAELSSTGYIFGHQIEKNPYHINVVRQQLTKHLVSIFPDVLDEVTTAFDELIPVQSKDGWVGVPAMSTIRQIVARTSSRVFIGLPICRDPEYLELATNVTVDFSKARITVGMFPSFLKSLAAKSMTHFDRRVEQGLRLLGGLIASRLRDMEKFGDKWTDRPNDMLQWIIHEEEKTGRIDTKNIVRMLLLINMAAIHTSSNSFVHALYHLAASSECMTVLREEVEAILQEDGWTKLAMGKMRKLDSFLRESQRMNGNNGISLKRMALKDLQFSNGVTLPAGTIVVAASTPTHMDEANYANPDVFNPWRFSDMRDDSPGSMKHQFVTTSVDYVSFGHGKHACPGRFFAANELKVMMAHIIMNYDVKFENEGCRPANKWFGLSFTPDATVKVLFKKRSGN